MSIVKCTFCLMMVFCGATFAQDVVTEAVSINANGEDANGASLNPIISPNGRFVAFLSIANNLAPRNHGAPQLYLKDRLGGAVVLVSQSTDGQSADFGSNALTISDDGRYVLFNSGADSLVPGDINNDPSIPDVGGQDIFLRDTWAGTTIRVSESEDGSAWITTTGRAMPNHDYTRIAMEVSEHDLVPGDSDFDKDVFVKDLQSGALTLIGTDSQGAIIEDDVRLTYYDPFGRFVVFDTASDMVVQPDTPGTRELFLKDLMSGEVTRMLFDKDGQPLSGQRIDPRVVSEGQTLFFASRDQMVNDPPLPVVPDGEVPLNLIYRTQTGSMQNVMVSLNEDGEIPSRGIAGFAVDGSGNLLVLETAAENLHPAGQQGFLFRIYMKDLNTNSIRLVSQSTAGENPNGFSEHPNVSSDGRFVVYESVATNLDPIASSGTQRVFVTDMFPERGPPPWALGAGAVAIPALGPWSLASMAVIFLLIGLSRVRCLE